MYRLMSIAPPTPSTNATPETPLRESMTWCLLFLTPVVSVGLIALFIVSLKVIPESANADDMCGVDLRAIMWIQSLIALFGPIGVFLGRESIWEENKGPATKFVLCVCWVGLAILGTFVFKISLDAHANAKCVSALIKNSSYEQSPVLIVAGYVYLALDTCVLAGTLLNMVCGYCTTDRK